MPASADRDRPPSHLLQPFTARYFALVFGFAAAYAVFRYAVFGSVPPAQWPLFLLNKILSFAGLILLGSSYLAGKAAPFHFNDRASEALFAKFCGIAGFSLTGMHVFMSLAMMSPMYYSKIYADGKLTFSGELCVATGVLGLWCIAIPAITTLPGMQDGLGSARWLRSQRMGYAGLLMTALPVLFLGSGAWFKPETWPGKMPPITMLSFLAAIIPVLVRWALPNGAEPRSPESGQ
jgi:hypothetical protein